MKSIVILGERYSKNLGDGVICQCVEGLVKKYAREDDSVVCIDLSCRKNYESSYRHPQTAIERLRKRVVGRMLLVTPIKRCLENKMGSAVYRYWRWYLENESAVARICEEHPADVVVFAGGELFKDYFTFYIRQFVRCYSKQNASIRFNACGCDEKNNQYTVRCFRKILGNPCVERVTIRNTWSTCRNLIDKEKYIFVPDPAICSSDFFQRSDVQQGIGLGIMSLACIGYDDNKVSGFWERIMTTLEQRRIPYRLFCNGDEADFALAQKIAATHGLPEEALLPAPRTPQELVLQITSFERICSFRMHSLIVAYAFGIPFVGLGWDKKLYDFADYIFAGQQICDWEQDGPDKIIDRMLTCQFDQSRFYDLKKKVNCEFLNLANNGKQTYLQ